MVADISKGISRGYKELPYNYQGFSIYKALQRNLWEISQAEVENAFEYHGALCNVMGMSRTSGKKIRHPNEKFFFIKFIQRHLNSINTLINPC